MNPETNRFEMLRNQTAEDREREASVAEMFNGVGKASSDPFKLLRPDGSPVPDTWAVFEVGEQVVIKNYTFEVKYIGETAILFEPVGVVEIGGKNDE